MVVTVELSVSVGYSEDARIAAFKPAQRKMQSAWILPRMKRLVKVVANEVAVVGAIGSAEVSEADAHRQRSSTYYKFSYTSPFRRSIHVSPCSHDEHRNNEEAASPAVHRRRLHPRRHCSMCRGALWSTSRSTWHSLLIMFRLLSLCTGHVL